MNWWSIKYVQSHHNIASYDSHGQKSKAYMNERLKWNNMKKKHWKGKKCLMDGNKDVSQLRTKLMKTNKYITFFVS